MPPETIIWRDIMGLDFLNDREGLGTIYHDMINSTMGRGNHIPHEWFFLELLTRHEIWKNQELAPVFVMFVLQYYPDYHWRTFNMKNYLSTSICECDLLSFEFQKKYEYCFEDEEDNILSQAMELGDIVTDFLVRYRNYSLVKSSGQKIIITAQSDCHKRFEHLLAEGYSLQRRAKVAYVETPDILSWYYPEVKGFFYKLPVLPTRDIGYPIDEIIEETETGKYKQII